MLNEVRLIGYLGADCQTSVAENGTTIKFNIATTRSIKIENKWDIATDWHVVRAFDKDYLIDKLKKGCLVLVLGMLRTKKYEDNEGNIKYFTYVKGQKIKVLKDPAIRQEQTVDNINGYETNSVDDFPL